MTELLESSREDPRSVIGIIRSLQAKSSKEAFVPKTASRVGFAFASKDRYAFTLESLRALDSEGGFDIIWNDGSKGPEVPHLANNWHFHKAKLAETNFVIQGGPDIAICFGLKRLLELDYDLIGLIENDVVVRPGWFSSIMRLFELGAKEGLNVGAASIRGYESRVLEYRDGYSIDCACGAGMVLFSRAAAEIILRNYLRPAMTKSSFMAFYRDVFRVDLQTSEWHHTPDGPLTLDWGYSPLLYLNGFVTVSSIPALAYDLQFDPKIALNTEYIRAEMNNKGLAHRRC